MSNDKIAGSMIEELKSCPFCGSRNSKIIEGVNSYLHCRKCEACGPERATRETAIAAWNTRAGERS